MACVFLIYHGMCVSSTMACVFHIKLSELLDDIMKRHIFGVTMAIANLHVIEFQKRGLPHTHMLFILRSEDY